MKWTAVWHHYSNYRCHPTILTLTENEKKKLRTFWMISQHYGHKKWKKPPKFWNRSYVKSKFVLKSELLQRVVRGNKTLARWLSPRLVPASYPCEKTTNETDLCRITQNWCKISKEQIRSYFTPELLPLKTKGKKNVVPSTTCLFGFCTAVLLVCSNKTWNSEKISEIRIRHLEIVYLKKMWKSPAFWKRKKKTGYFSK